MNFSSVTGSKPHANAMLKGLLAIAFGLACLLMLMTGTSEARGGGSRGGGRSSGRRHASHGHTHRTSGHKHKHQPVHKHKHKHKHQGGQDGMDMDPDGDGDADGEGASGDNASSADEAEGQSAERGADGIAESSAAKPVVYGMEITALYKGTAAKEGLEIGDVILKVNGVSTPTFEALSRALAQSGGRAEVLVLRDDDDEDDEPEVVMLYPQNGLIGVAVEQVQVED